MKESWLLYLIILLLFTVFVRGEELQIEITPNEIWVGDSVKISCWYSGNITNTTLTTPWVYIPRTARNRTLTQNGSYYNYFYNPPDGELGTYKVFCSNGTLNSSEVSFSQNTLKLDIIASPTIVYRGKNMEIHAKVIQTGDSEKILTNEISSNKFKVFLNEEEIEIDEDATYPPEDSDDKWIIITKKIPLELKSLVYDLSVELTFKEEKVSDTKQIEIKTPFQFNLVNIDETWVKPNDNITLTIQSSYEGKALDISKYDFLVVKIDNRDCEFSLLGGVGTNFDIRIKVPDISSGEYELNVKAEYQDPNDENLYYLGNIEEKVNYVVTVSGDIINSEDKAVNTLIEFKNSKITESVGTDGGGHYSVDIPIGTYDVQLQFPKSKVILSDVYISDFDDSIRYDEVESGINIEGVGIERIFVYEFALTFDDAYIEMKYDDSRIPDENRIIVYRCHNWNFGKRNCVGEWDDINVDIDTIRNQIKFNTTSLSAFAVGYKKEMLLDANLEEEKYYLNDIIKVLGIVEDGEQKPIVDGKIKGRIIGTNIEFTTKTDNGGVFTIEFQGPEKEGNYELFITAEKSSYEKVNQTIEFEAIKSKRLTLTLPSSLKITQGENTTTEFLINNLGQTDFYDLKVSIEGIPNYYSLSETEFSEIKAGGEKGIQVVFEIPENANLQTYSGKVRVEYDDGTLQDRLVLTILKLDEDQTSNTEDNDSKFSLPSANIVIPSFSSETVIISAFGILTIGGALWFKKKRENPEKEREDVKNLLLDIRREIERDQEEIRKSKSQKPKKRGRPKKKVKVKKKRKNRISYAS